MNHEFAGPGGNFVDEEETAQYDEFVGKVMDEIESDEQAQEGLDWEMEELALDLYGTVAESRAGLGSIERASTLADCPRVVSRAIAKRH